MLFPLQRRHSLYRMRVLFRMVLTLLIAVPVVLGLALFLALEGVRGATPPQEGEETLSTQRVGPGKQRTA